MTSPEARSTGPWIAGLPVPDQTPSSIVIVGAYPLDPAVISNGVEAVVVYLIEGLKRISAISLQVVSITDAVSAEVARDWDGVTVHYLPSTRRWRNVTLDAVNKARIRRKVAALRPDLIHVHNSQMFPYIGCRVPSQPLVTTIHGLLFEEVKYETEPWDWLRRPPRRLLERLVLRRSRNLVAVSEYVRRAIEPLTPARVTVIDNPVDERYFALGAGPLQPTEDSAACTVLFVGTIMRRKNILGLIEAIEQLRPDCPRIQLRIVGGVQHQSYYEELVRYISVRGLQGVVHFLGRIVDRELLTEYANCTIVASASLEESAGMIFEQAMAARKPVVGVAVGGVPFVVRHNETGLLVRSGDVTGFAAALRLLVQNPLLRARMGDAGRRIALERFTPLIAATQTVAVYGEMLQRRARPEAGTPR